MFVKSCPKCGRMPKIEECFPGHNGVRRYHVYCPNYCHVVSNANLDSCCSTFYSQFICSDPNSTDFLLIVEGNYDNNMIYKMWNKHLV